MYSYVYANVEEEEEEEVSGYVCSHKGVNISLNLQAMQQKQQCPSHHQC